MNIAYIIEQQQPWMSLMYAIGLPVLAVIQLGIAYLAFRQKQYKTGFVIIGTAVYLFAIGLFSASLI